MKIVISTSYGGFGISKEASEFIIERRGSNGYKEMKRNDPDLIAAVEALGERANGSFSYLNIVEIPDGVDWIIEEYDGNEWVAEKHRTWR